MFSRRTNKAASAALAFFSAYGVGIMARAQTAPAWAETLGGMNDGQTVSLDIINEYGIVPQLKASSPSPGYVSIITGRISKGDAISGLTIGYGETQILGGINFRQNVTGLLNSVLPSSVNFSLSAVPQSWRNAAVTFIDGLPDYLKIPKVKGAEENFVKSGKSVSTALLRSVAPMIASSKITISLAAQKAALLAQYGQAPMHIRGSFNELPFGSYFKPWSFLRLDAAVSPVWGALQASGQVPGVVKTTHINVPFAGTYNIPQIGWQPYSARQNYAGIGLTMQASLDLVGFTKDLLGFQSALPQNFQLGPVASGNISELHAIGKRSALPAKQEFGSFTGGIRADLQFNSNTLFGGLGL